MTTIPSTALTPVDPPDIAEELWDVDAFPPERKPWAIENTGQAEWVMSLLAECDALIHEVGQHADQARSAIARWVAERLETPGRADDGRATPSIMEQRAWCASQLESYAIAQRTPKRATLNLIGGSVPTRLAKPTLEIVDQEALIDWCEEHAPDLVKVERSVLVSVLRAAATLDAESGQITVHRLVSGVNADGEEIDVDDPFTVDAIPGVEITAERITATAKATGVIS